MKKGTDQMQKNLLTVIGVLAIMLAAALVFKGYGYYQDKKQEKEWAARHDEVQQEIDSVRVQIEELAGDAEALQVFLDEQVNSVLVLDEWQEWEEGDGNGQFTENSEDGEGAGGEENGQEPEGQESGQGQEASGEGMDEAVEASSGAIVIDEIPQETPGDEGQAPAEGQGMPGEQDGTGNNQEVPDSQTAQENGQDITDSQTAGEGQGMPGNETTAGEGQGMPGNETTAGEGQQSSGPQPENQALVVGTGQETTDNQTTPGEGESQPGGQAENEGAASVPDINQQDLEEAAEGAIVIDAPPAPKPPAPKPPEKEPEEVENTVSGNAGKTPEGEEEKDTVSGNGTAVPEETKEDTVSGNGAIIVPEETKEDTVSGNGAAALEGAQGEETVSGNVTEAVSEDTISGNAVVDGRVIPYVRDIPEMSLEERRKIRSSYSETMETNGADREYIENSSYDFSDIKIACLGDSITAGSNLDKMENYQQYSYPSKMKDILQAEEVYNLGIGGSSYGRYWDNAFVDRYKEIPKDSDIILVFGGANDGFAASAKELGSLEEKKARTFYGDVDELMRGLKKDYPDAKIIFATPLPNVLHDYLRAQRDYLLPQNVYAKAVKELAAQYDIDVIDLYNSNILDTHDAQVISTYMPDGVHGNPDGYQILAEHMARGVIEIVQNEGLESGDSKGQDTVSGNGAGVQMDDTVSGNGADILADGTVSSNSAQPAAEDTISGNGLNAETSPAPQRKLTPEEAKRIEEERLRAEQERLEREREEAAKAEENNKKVAEDAVVIDPVQTPPAGTGASGTGTGTAEAGTPGTGAGAAEAGASGTGTGTTEAGTPGASGTGTGTAEAGTPGTDAGGAEDGTRKESGADMETGTSGTPGTGAGQGGQHNSVPDGPVSDANGADGTKDYEYGGEAIVIQ